jgi:hypothetical protein
MYLEENCNRLQWLFGVTYSKLQGLFLNAWHVKKCIEGGLIFLPIVENYINYHENKLIQFEKFTFARFMPQNSDGFHALTHMLWFIKSSLES